MLNDFIQLITSRKFQKAKKKLFFLEKIIHNMPRPRPDVQYICDDAIFLPSEFERKIACLYNQDSFPCGNTLIESGVIAFFFDLSCEIPMQMMTFKIQMENRRWRVLVDIFSILSTLH